MLVEELINKLNETHMYSYEYIRKNNKALSKVEWLDICFEGYIRGHRWSNYFCWRDYLDEYLVRNWNYLSLETKIVACLLACDLAEESERASIQKAGSDW